MPDESRQLHLQVSGPLDRQAMEALRLEIRQLARRYGLSLKDFRVEEATTAD